MSGGEIGPDLVERMVALVRDLHADHLKYDLRDRQQDFCKRTAEIVAELPQVDGDIAEAAALCRATGWVPDTSMVTDHGSGMHLAYEAIKRGRELERAGK